MPRGVKKFNEEAGRDIVCPVLLVRILNIPEVQDPSSTHSLYLCGEVEDDLIWFDEKDEPIVYKACGIKYTNIEVSTDNPISTAELSIDNVNREFSALAQYAKLNNVEVQVFRGFKNILQYPDGAQMIFLGHIKNIVISEYAVKAEIWADFSLKIQVPRRLYWTRDFPYLPAAKDVRKVYMG